MAATGRQAWLLGFLNREIGVGKGHNMMRNYAFCTFSLSPKGSEFVEAPHECPLPLAGAQRFIETNSETQPHKTATRKGKGCHALPQVSLKSATYIYRIRPAPTLTYMLGKVESFTLIFRRLTGHISMRGIY